MARVNVGVNPKYLSDQHLIAESVEITMITGGLRKNGYKIKSPIPKKLNLGAGHINFFKDKIGYLHTRLICVNTEMERRGFNHSTKIVLDEYPPELINQWRPNEADSKILRERIVERLITPKSGRDPKTLHRYKRVPLQENLISFTNKLLNSELYYV